MTTRARRGVTGIGALLLVTAFGCAGAPTQATPKPPSLDDPKPNPSASASEATAPADSAEAQEAYAALEAKDLVQARAKATAALAKAPKSALAHLVLGVCDESEKNVDSAITHYQAALEADPKSYAAAVNLTAILVDRKDWDRAIEIGKKGLEGTKGSWELWANLGWAFRGKGTHDKAAVAFGNAAKLNPKEAELPLRRGEELLAATPADKDGAQKALRESMSLANGDEGILAAVGAGLGEADDFAGCALVLGKLKAPSAEQLRVRAVCKHKTKDLPGARADLDAAIKASATAQMRWQAAAFAQEAGDDKACKAHLAAMAKLATTPEDKAKAGKADALCKKSK